MVLANALSNLFMARCKKVVAILLRLQGTLNPKWMGANREVTIMKLEHNVDWTRLQLHLQYLFIVIGNGKKL